MSSLPPYQPPRTRRLAWLLNKDGVETALAAAGPGVGDVSAAWVEGEAVRKTIENLTSCREWHTIDGAAFGAASGARVAERVRGHEGSVIVVADEDLLHTLLCDLLEVRSDAARFRFIPGATTTVQLLEDRAVLRHINQGGALQDLLASSRREAGPEPPVTDKK